MRLALDLGTNTGFAATSENGGVFIVGSWCFKPSRHESEGVRYLRFQQELARFHQASPVTRVFYEAVERHAGTVAAHVYGGLRGVLVAFCEAQTPKVPYEGVPVGTIKKFWTGKGNATKDMMVATAVANGFEVDNDNEADAIAILKWALANRFVGATP